MANNRNLKLVGICGRSCSGKGVVTEALASVNCEVLALQADNYFRKVTPCSYGGYSCWEHLDCISSDRLLNDLYALKTGGSIDLMIEAPWMHPEIIKITSQDMDTKQIIVVDGFLIFAVPSLLDVMDFKIFIDVSDSNLLERRVKRNGEGERNYIENVVIPVSREYQMQNGTADVVIDGNQSKQNVINDSVKYIRERLPLSAACFRPALPPERSPWPVHPGDLLTDNAWHPISFSDLKDWVKNERQKLDRGQELSGNTFRYRKNPDSDTFEIRLSRKHYVYRYNLTPTEH